MLILYLKFFNSVDSGNKKGNIFYGCKGKFGKMKTIDNCGPVVTAVVHQLSLGQVFMKAGRYKI